MCKNVSGYFSFFPRNFSNTFHGKCPKDVLELSVPTLHYIKHITYLHYKHLLPIQYVTIQVSRIILHKFVVPFLVPDNFYRHKLLSFVVIALDNLAERTLTKHLKHFVAIHHVVVHYLTGNRKSSLTTTAASQG